MKTVNFEFDIDDKVISPFGEEGIISMLALDERGNAYYVQTKNNSSWFKEGQLKAKE